MKTEPVVLPSPWKDVILTVVIPTFNEVDNLPHIVDALFDLPLPNLRLVIVDDNSPDGTGQLADKLARHHNQDNQRRITVLHRPKKEGLGRAYVDGMTRALQDGAEFIVQMDADFSHSPDYIPQMLGVLLSTDAGVVIGSRYVEGGSVDRVWKFGRRALSWWGNFYARIILGMRIRDITAGYKLWRRLLLLDIHLEKIRSDGYIFQVETNYISKKLGYKLIELPIYFEDRRVGQSKMSMRVKVEAALTPLLLAYRYRRLRRSRKELHQNN